MIKVKNLTKKYGDFKAVDNISFEVQPGEILGFLGPNGAGKSTTMKILTCYLSATSGEVTVGDCNVLDESYLVRQRIGYIPENTPLYNEMNVLEYLNFLTEIHNLSGDKKLERIKFVLKACGLQDKIRAEISELSKGYRQRVALAQTMIHDPEILILDEPTAGLDPNQIVEIRHLIKEISKKKTIILCTHILSEVEATCDRVIIINKGKIVGEGTPDTLKSQTTGQTRLIIEVKGGIKEVTNELQSIKGITKINKLESNEKGICKLELEVEPDLDLRSQINHHLLDHGFELVSLQKVNLSFEDVFAKLTK